MELHRVAVALIHGKVTHFVICLGFVSIQSCGNRWYNIFAFPYTQSLWTWRYRYSKLPLIQAPQKRDGEASFALLGTVHCAWYTPSL